jgi:hypothetical protein
MNGIGVDQAKALVRILKEHSTLKSLCGNTGNETELDMSSKMYGAGDAIMLVPEIIDNGAMTSLNLASNGLGEIVLAEGWRSKDNDGCYPWIGPDGQEQNEKPGKPEGIIAIANAIPNMGAILVLYLESNDLYAAGGKALAEGLKGLKGNQVITELNISNNLLGWTNGVGLDMSGVIALAGVIPDMEALLVLDISNNSIGVSWYLNPAYEDDPEREYKYKNPAGGKSDGEPAGGLGPIGVIAVANAIKDMRAISSANLLMNSVGTEQAQALANILKEHATLKSLCGNKGDETELDMSGKGMRAWDAIMLAPEIADNGAISSLNLASNSIGGCYRIPGNTYSKFIAMPEGTALIATLTFEFTARLYLGPAAIANAIKDMGAMTSLNLASNYLGYRGAEIVVEAIKVTKCTPAISMAFACSSVFSNNCCYLLLSAGYGGDDKIRH